MAQNPLRRSRARSLPSAAVEGLAAGTAGALVMTGWQELSAKLMSSDSQGDDSKDQDPWEQAPVPAKVARRLARAVGWDPPAKRIGLLTNVMHYGYGAGWGIAYSTLVARVIDGPLPLRGAAFGTTVWVASYAQLVPTGFYSPPWKYSPEELALDLSYHLVYGIGTAAAFAGLDSAL